MSRGETSQTLPPYIPVGVPGFKAQARFYTQSCTTGLGSRTDLSETADHMLHLLVYFRLLSGRNLCHESAPAEMRYRKHLPQVQLRSRRPQLKAIRKYHRQRHPTTTSASESTISKAPTVAAHSTIRPTSVMLPQPQGPHG